MIQYMETDDVGMEQEGAQSVGEAFPLPQLHTGVLGGRGCVAQETCCLTTSAIVQCSLKRTVHWKRSLCTVAAQRNPMDCASSENLLGAKGYRIYSPPAGCFHARTYNAVLPIGIGKPLE